VPSYNGFPNIEAMAGAVMRAALTCGVYSSIPKTPTWPLVTYKRIGGVPAIRQRLDRARIQVDVWGTSQTVAFNLATLARVALLGMEGQTYSSPVAGFVSAVDDDLGLIWLPDPVTARDRYIFGVSIYAHSA